MQRDDKVIENRDILLEMLIIEGIYNNKIKTFDTSKVPNHFIQMMGLSWYICIIHRPALYALPYNQYATNEPLMPGVRNYYSALHSFPK